MNKVELTGRLTRDPEVRNSGDKEVVIFTLAVDRRGEGADFIRCVAFGKTGEFVSKWFKKGMKVGACGRIQTGSYKDKDGKPVYTTDVVCDDVEFEESKKSQDYNVPGVNMPVDFTDLPDGLEEDLPFV